jgi:hypothetical protein
MTPGDLPIPVTSPVWAPQPSEWVTRKPATMTAENAAILRKQFPPEQIGKLPRKGITLDYVGHADTTSRLLEADREWSWEPLALDDHGLPRLDLDDQGNPVGLWIKLTVCGVTRLGYGSCPSTQNDAVKVLIGDALRNAAMRFGVAIDLWAKGDRSDPTIENPSGPAAKASRSGYIKPPVITVKPGSKGGRITPAPQKPPETPQAVAEHAAKATTIEQLRDVWKTATAAGMLQKEIVTPDGEKLTIQDLLYRRSDQLSFPKSSNPAESETGGNSNK